MCEKIIHQSNQNLFKAILQTVDADLIAELVDELIEAEVDLGLHLVVEELLLEDVEGVEGGVVVQVQRVQHALHVRRVLGIIKLNSN